MRVELFGTVWETPIFLSPVGSLRAFHPQGELAVARAAAARKHLNILSMNASFAVEEVAREQGTAPWFQLYMPTDWGSTEKVIRRVEAAGCPVLVWTVDLPAGRNTETMEMLRRTDTRTCTDCHATSRGRHRGEESADLQRHRYRHRQPARCHLGVRRQVEKDDEDEDRDQGP